MFGTCVPGSNYANANEERKKKAKIKYSRETARTFRKNLKQSSIAGSFHSVRDYYEVLALKSDATAREIKLKYFEKARKYHPDRNKGALSPAQQKEWNDVSTAYKCLSEPDQRSKYDENQPMRAALVGFYEQHNPSCLTVDKIEDILEKWKGRELELLCQLHERYDAKSYIPKDKKHACKSKDFCNCLSIPEQENATS